MVETPPPSQPRAGLDYPRNLIEFGEFFPDEKACVAYLEHLRWADGFICPSGHVAAAAWRTERGLSVCPTCRRQVSATAGTIFEGTRKLRRAMVRPDRELLHNEVEADEAYVGGREEGLSGGRRLEGKALVVGAVEVRGRGCGRTRLRVVPDASARSLSGFIRANVEPNTIVWTDGWQGYASLAGMGYRHRPRSQRTPEQAVILLPRIHQVFGNLQTWLRGTHHGVSTKHLQAYLDEFTFRFNRRRTPMAAFQTLLGLGGQQSPTTYKEWYAVESTG